MYDEYPAPVRHVLIHGGDIDCPACEMRRVEHEDHPYGGLVQGCELCEWEQQPVRPPVRPRLIPDLR